jgi:hypothetical protein
LTSVKNSDPGAPEWLWGDCPLSTPDWAQADTPTSRATVVGLGTYEKLPDRLKELRDQSDKYFLVRIYGSLFDN